MFTSHCPKWMSLLSILWLDLSLEKTADITRRTGPLPGAHSPTALLEPPLACLPPLVRRFVFRFP